MNGSNKQKYPITITTADVGELRDAGAGALLVWQEGLDAVAVLVPEQIPGPDQMIIAGHGALADIAKGAQEQGEARDDDIVQALSGIAMDWQSEWPQVKAMTYALMPLRTRLGDHRIFLDGAPHCHTRDGEPMLTESYRCLTRGRRIEIATPFAFAGAVSIRIQDCDLAWDIQDRWRMDLRMQGRFPGEIPRLITTLVANAAPIFA